MTEESTEILQVKEIPTSISKRSRITFGNIDSTKLTHGMYTYPAKFVPQIARWAINYSRIKPGQILLDPFCGSGTTLLESKIVGINSYGIDKNPLARLLSKVKTTPLFPKKPTLLSEKTEQLIHKIKNQKKSINLENQEDVNLHYNWRFWFEEKTMRELIHIKRTIRNFQFDSAKKTNQDLVDFFLIILAITIKKVSYLDEKQIKVKKDHDKVRKGLPSPTEVFYNMAKKQVKSIFQLNKNVIDFPKTLVKIIGDDARNIKLKKNTVDLVVTSPPYLNAIDYPFAHKQELFILDLVKPDDYRPHSREYVGVSERVLLKEMFKDLHLTNFQYVDKYIKDIYSENNVDANRAFIMYQYFTGMTKAMSEIHRVLKDNSYFIMVVGSNNIRNRYVPTHELLKNIAEKEIGFSTTTYFYHRMKRKKLGIPRNSTGNVSPDDMVIVFKKKGN